MTAQIKNVLYHKNGRYFPRRGERQIVRMSTKSKKVYVTQIPNRKDKATGAIIPAVDISAAVEHGEVVIMLPPKANFFATADLIKQLREFLNEYDYENGDSLLFIGDPAIIVAAAMLLGKMYGHAIILKWDRHVMRYVPSHIKI